MKRSRILGLALLWCVTGLVLAADEPKLDRLMVYGTGFAFGVKEPTGWHGDTDNASKYAANILFYRRGESHGSAKALIRVRVGNKTDENTAEDLAYDMKGYKEKYPKIEFVELQVSHPSYAVFAKLFTLPKKFCEYVVYINPGPENSHLLSASMNTGKQPATEAELAAFREVIESLSMLSGAKVN